MTDYTKKIYPNGFSILVGSNTVAMFGAYVKTRYRQNNYVLDFIKTLNFSHPISVYRNKSIDELAEFEYSDGEGGVLGQDGAKQFLTYMAEYVESKFLEE